MTLGTVFGNRYGQNTQLILSTIEAVEDGFRRHAKAWSFDLALASGCTPLGSLGIETGSLYFDLSHLVGGEVVGFTPEGVAVPAQLSSGLVPLVALPSEAGFMLWELARDDHEGSGIGVTIVSRGEVGGGVADGLRLSQVGDSGEVTERARRDLLSLIRDALGAQGLASGLYLHRPQITVDTRGKDGTVHMAVGGSASLDSGQPGEAFVCLVALSDDGECRVLSTAFLGAGAAAPRIIGWAAEGGTLVHATISSDRVEPDVEMDAEAFVLFPSNASAAAEIMASPLDVGHFSAGRLRSAFCAIWTPAESGHAWRLFGLVDLDPVVEQARPERLFPLACYQAMVVWELLR